MAYGARLESVLGESPRGFESPILRHIRKCPEKPWFSGHFCAPDLSEALVHAGRQRFGQPAVRESPRICEIRCERRHERKHIPLAPSHCKLAYHHGAVQSCCVIYTATARYAVSDHLVDKWTDGGGLEFLQLHQATARPKDVGRKLVRHTRCENHDKHSSERRSSGCPQAPPIPGDTRRNALPWGARGRYLSAPQPGGRQRASGLPSASPTRAERPAPSPRVWLSARSKRGTSRLEGPARNGSQGGRIDHASGMGPPKVSRVTASGSGPPRTPVSRASIWAISAVVSSKSKTSKFSVIRATLVDFGITCTPF